MKAFLHFDFASYPKIITESGETIDLFPGDNIDTLIESMANACYAWNIGTLKVDNAELLELESEINYYMTSKYDCEELVKIEVVEE